MIIFSKRGLKTYCGKNIIKYLILLIPFTINKKVTIHLKAR